MMADIIGIALSAVFLVLVGTAVMSSMRNATMRQLSKAIRLQLAAVAVAVLSVIVSVWGHDGWWMFLLDWVKIASPLITVYFLRQRREFKSAQVVAEAERILRTYQRDGSL